MADVYYRHASPYKILYAKRVCRILTTKEANIKVKAKKREKVYNIPNLLSLIRILMSLIIVCMIFLGVSLWIIVIIFAIAALTDAADGFIARRFNMKTEIGRRLDMIADRVLMLCVILALISYLIINNMLNKTMLIQIIMLISREIIATPFFIISLVIRNGNPVPNARIVAKLTTLLQGITFPMIILGWPAAVYFVVLTCLTGIISGILYAKDSVFNIYNK